MKYKNKIYQFHTICANIPQNSPTSDKSTNHKKQVVYFGNAVNYADKMDFCKTLLSVDEIGRMEKFVFDDDRLTYCLSHGFLRVLLSKITKIPNAELKFDYYKYIKPCLLNSSIDFNLSHSKNYFAFAVAGKTELNIGIDIEILNNLKDYKSLIRDHMHNDEKTYILDNFLSDEEQLRRFYEIWTRKEAFLKMLGIGISIDLREINVFPGENIINMKIPEDINVGNTETSIYTKSTIDFVLSVSTSFNCTPDFTEINS